MQPDRVKLVLPMVSLIPDEVDRALRLRFGERYTKLDKMAVQAVVTAQLEGSMAAQGALAGFFAPPLTVAERAVADLEGWIFGVR